MNVYLIIGDANTGKSSLIRCLTGYDQPGIGNFAVVNGKPLSAHVVISALQKYLQQSWQSPPNYIQYVQNARATGIIDSSKTPAILVPLWEQATMVAPQHHSILQHSNRLGGRLLKQHYWILKHRLAIILIAKFSQV